MNNKTLLSTLWTLMVLNYLFRFVFSLYLSERLQQLLNGDLHGMMVTQGFLLAISILMEIPIAMILLSRLLKHRPNRILNILVGFLMAGIHLSGMSPQGVALHYYFFNIIETVICVSIIIIAFKWKPECKTEYETMEVQRNDTGNDE